jgi:hypothetical protein
MEPYFKQPELPPDCKYLEPLIKGYERDWKWVPISLNSLHFFVFLVGVITIRMLKRTSARYWTIKVNGVDWHVAFGLLNPGNVIWNGFSWGWTVIKHLGRLEWSSPFESVLVGTTISFVFLTDSLLMK